MINKYQTLSNPFTTKLKKRENILLSRIQKIKSYHLKNMFKNFWFVSCSYETAKKDTLKRFFKLKLN